LTEPIRKRLPHARRRSSSRLRVLQICEATSAGVGRHTIDLVRGLAAADCEVHLLYGRARIDAEFERGLLRLPDVRSTVVPMKRAPGPGDAAAVAFAVRYAREHGPFDVIHGQSSKGGAIARLAGATTTSAVVYTPHCIITMSPAIGALERGIYGLAERALARVTNRILAASEEEYDHLCELGISQERVRLVLHGLGPPPSASKQALRAELGLPAHALVIGFVGRLCAQKDPALALRAFAEVARTRPDVWLAVVGGGELEANCVALARELGVAERVAWLGYRSGYEAMLAFDLLVLSSAYEGLPYVMLERLFARLPLVTTPVGGVSVAVENGVDGFVTPAGDATVMAHALATLLDDPARREAFGWAALLKSRHFELGSMIERVREVYADCTNERAARSEAPGVARSFGANVTAPVFRFGSPR
jgi:glycosyltransferase involved in cell wall biosynthesis